MLETQTGSNEQFTNPQHQPPILSLLSISLFIFFHQKYQCVQFPLLFCVPLPPLLCLSVSPFRSPVGPSSFLDLSGRPGVRCQQLSKMLQFLSCCCLHFLMSVPQLEVSNRSPGRKNPILLLRSVSSLCGGCAAVARNYLTPSAFAGIPESEPKVLRLSSLSTHTHKIRQMGLL